MCAAAALVGALPAAVSHPKKVYDSHSYLTGPSLHSLRLPVVPTLYELLGHNPRAIVVAQAVIGARVLVCSGARSPAQPAPAVVLLPLRRGAPGRLFRLRQPVVRRRAQRFAVPVAVGPHARSRRAMARRPRLAGLGAHRVVGVGVHPQHQRLPSGGRRRGRPGRTGGSCLAESPGAGRLRAEPAGRRRGRRRLRHRIAVRANGRARDARPGVDQSAAHGVVRRPRYAGQPGDPCPGRHQVALVELRRRDQVRARTGPGRTTGRGCTTPENGSIWSTPPPIPPG